MSTERPQIDQLYVKLKQFVDKQQYKKAFATVGEVLGLAPENDRQIPQQIRVTLLVYLERYQDALDSLYRYKIVDNHPLLHAYCKYRLSQTNEAADIARYAINTSDTDREGLLNLIGILEYKLGQFNKSVLAYQQLKEQGQLTSADVQTNMVAALLAGGQSASIPELVQQLNINKKDSFEVAYNIACGQVMESDWMGAQDNLELAQRLGTETLMQDGADDAELATELAPIITQLAFVAHARGEHDSAVTQLESVLKQPCDPDVGAIAKCNNLVSRVLAASAAKPRRSLTKKSAGEWLRKCESLMEKGGQWTISNELSKQLNKQQIINIYYNISVLLFIAQRVQECQTVLARGAELGGGQTLEYVTLKAMCDLQNDDVDKSLAHLSDVTRGAVSRLFGSFSGDLSRFPPAVVITLIKGQLLAGDGRYSEAADCMNDESLGDIVSKPAWLATLIGLYQVSGQMGDVEKLLTRGLAVAKRSNDAMGERWCLLRLTMLKLEQSDKQASKELLEQCLNNLKRNIKDVESQDLISIVRATASLAPERAADLRAILGKRVASLDATPAVDVAMIERNLLSSNYNSAGMRMWKLPDVRGVKRVADDAGPVPGTKSKKRRRRRRLPKGYDPANPPPPPNPERWLPKWQRSDAKKKSKRRKEAVKGTQGAGKVDNSLDATQASSSASGPARISGDAAAPQAPSGGPALPKRKKRGGAA